MCGRVQCRPYETPLNSNVNGNNDLKFYLEVDERAAGAHASTRVSTQSTPCEYREFPVGVHLQRSAHRTTITMRVPRVSTRSTHSSRPAHVSTLSTPFEYSEYPV
jgi:hypothetical protein